MQLTRRYRFVAVMSAGFAGLMMTAAANAQISFGQIDDFQDGTTQGWGGGPGSSNVATGGPAGAGDAYLQVIGTGGFGQGSRVATFNDTQWPGDYVAAGVDAIQVDMANFGASNLEMRAVLFFTASGDWTSTNTTVIPADGIWRSYTFGLGAGDLTQVGGVGSHAAALASVGRLMFRHQPGAPAGIGGGVPIAGTLGIDNITAIPEPSSVALLAIGGLALLRRKK